MPSRLKLELLVVGCLWVFSARALAVAPEVKDEGKYFSAGEIKKANQEIRDIYRKYDRDLLIETLPSLPADMKAKIKSMSKEDKEKHISKWAMDRADAAAVNGIYIVLCKEPPFHWVVFTFKSAQTIFTTYDHHQLGTLLGEKLRGKKNDEVLQEAIRFVRDKLEKAKDKEK